MTCELYSGSCDGCKEKSCPDQILTIQHDYKTLHYKLNKYKSEHELLTTKISITIAKIFEYESIYCKELNTIIDM